MSRIFDYTILLACMAMFTACARADSRKTSTRIRVDGPDQLPAHSYRIPTTATDLVQEDEQYAALARQLDADLRADLAAYDIQDRATLKGYYNTLSQLALQRGDHDEAVAWQDSIRAAEDDPAQKLLAGLLVRSVVEARRTAGDQRAAFRESYRRAVAALPYSRFRRSLQSMKASFEQFSAASVLGSIRTQIEPAITNGQVSRELAQRLVQARTALAIGLPLNDVVVQTLAEVIAAHAVAKPNLWTAREISLKGRADLTPVTIGIYDSGTDVTLFPGRLFTNQKENPANGRDDDGNGFVDDVHGIGYDLQHRKTSGLLLPLSFGPQQLDQYRRLSQGFSDLQAGVDSPEAMELRQARSSGESVMQGVWEYLDYAHGTHVAGIAVAGNPAARILTVAVAYDNYRTVPTLPTLQLVEAEARKYREIVAYLRNHGARVVNMSFGYTAADYESALEKNNAGGSAEQRKALAQRMFDISAGALRQAIASASDILFITGSGNEGVDNRTPPVVPGSFELSNLITVAAVDSAGNDAGFNYGKVDIYANGVQVRSYVPGGERRYSGTSAAAPQVANLAAKLLALKPNLSVAQLRDLILRGADETTLDSRMRIRLLNPKRSLELMLEP